MTTLLGKRNTRIDTNLASRPFVNHTVYHLSFVLLGLFGLYLCFHNVSWYFKHHAEVERMGDQIQNLVEERELNDRKADALVRQVDSLQKNRRFRRVADTVDNYLRKRQFSWIPLLNRLQDVVPNDVKLESINPRIEGETVEIILRCRARREESMNEFIAALENQDEFDRVIIHSEKREGTAIAFPLKMLYSPTGFPDTLVTSGRDSKESTTFSLEPLEGLDGEPMDPIEAAVQTAVIPMPGDDPLYDDGSSEGYDGWSTDGEELFGPDGLDPLGGEPAASPRGTSNTGAAARRPLGGPPQPAKKPTGEIHFAPDASREGAAKGKRSRASELKGSASGGSGGSESDQGPKVPKRGKK